MISVCKTDTGKVRSLNEDSIFSSDENIGTLENLYIVADGMGGHKAGEVASSLAIKSFIDYVKNNYCQDKNLVLDFLVNAAAHANDIVYEKSKTDPECSGMGTTLSACTFVDKKIYCVHVGDSRIYLANNDIDFKQLSIDHTYVNEMLRTGKINSEQAKSHPQKNVITRAVGIEKNLNIDAFVVPIDINIDNYCLICSDGLSSVLDDKEIFDLVLDKNLDLNLDSNTDINKNLAAKKSVLENKVDELVYLANKKGGYDNISVILIYYEGCKQ